MDFRTQKRIEGLVRQIFEETIQSMGNDNARKEENLFTRALLGLEGNVYSRIERSLVTILGHNAPRFFEIFFSDVEKLPAPFDFEGELRGDRYQIKVVTGPRVFNSTMRDVVATESLKYPRPIILTLQGEYFREEFLERALWMCSYDSWRFVSGEPYTYSIFRDIVFEVSREYRERLKHRIVVATRW